MTGFCFLTKKGERAMSFPYKKTLISSIMTIFLVLPFLFSVSGCKTLPPASEATSPEITVSIPTEDAVPEDQAPDISGVWQGTLETGPLGLVLEFSFAQDDLSKDIWSASLSVPQQGAYSLPVARTEFDGEHLFLDMATLQATYSATVVGTGEDMEISGTFTQGASFPLVLRKIETASVQPRRPQEPLPPYPYRSEDVMIPTEEGFLLGATITSPDDGLRHPAVILITGSGQQDRDETIFGHKPFKVIADSLTRSGFVVVRADDRGVGASGGDASQATTLDFTRDAEALLDHTLSLDSVDPSAVGIAGHSEGALITLILAARRPDVSFIILLNGPGIAGKDLVLAQSRELMRAQGIPEETIKASSEINRTAYSTALDSSLSQEEKADRLRHIMLAAGLGEKEIDTQISALLSPWYTTFLGLDPQDYLPEISIPVFIVSGSKDLQVPSSLNVAALNDGLSKGESTVSIAIYPTMNHILQPASTGLPVEYPLIETTILPELLTDLEEWLISITN